MVGLASSDRLTVKSRSPLALRLVVLAVAFNGLLLVGGTLIDQFIPGRRPPNGFGALIGVQLLAALGLLYLSSLLGRRKRLAWVLSVLLYGFILGLNSLGFLELLTNHHWALIRAVRSLLVPLLVLLALLYYREEFSVKSDIQSFRQSLGFIIVALLVPFIYGTTGFVLMDQPDFHQEISVATAAHYTVDQFGLTTPRPLKPYTRRAHIFIDSLEIISIGALAYVAISLFQPIKFRLQDQTKNREIVRGLLQKYPASSEDFFKLWPHDKMYFFNNSQSAALALHVTRGVALIAGDPAGNARAFGALIRRFGEVCYRNDWQMAFINASAGRLELYKSHGLSCQKIGREAVVHLDNFSQKVQTQKYFRQIDNKFRRLGYTTELLLPPHDPLVMERAAAISADWLGGQNRTERGFIMGYMTPAYLQQCALMVVRDSDGVIQAYLNQIESYDEQEANLDLLRHASGSPGNINDFLLMGFIDHLRSQGFKRLNLGLCPLSGLKDENSEADRTLLNNAMRLVYGSGDRFYSFAGLERFKAKYAPEWNDRYIVYEGGTAGFLKTFNALTRAMKVKNFSKK